MPDGSLVSETLRGVQSHFWSHWCTILMPVAVRLLMHPRCRQVTAFVVSDAFDVLNEFCGAWRCPGTRRPSAGLYAHLERRSVRPLAAASWNRAQGYLPTGLAARRL